MAQVRPASAPYTSLVSQLTAGAACSSYQPASQEM